ncbi:hypothetical protein T4B_12222 [Trichinella pseudospiralis]|uniref:Uncharacterized protein n=2 Tax=Trichinella pseudospiralis TaxID=6337 RepID=A0A0V1IWB0_TRIPS|nr:hypothetical protein T4A_2509 [Trichinella pseudospiralis]KRY91265.1 hypothetical protein T4D_13089 [Trichinella pseudospiralis]KRZ26998.1 hypothetical protein T4B_12222 [Trichinella pseudospiralis]KRZ41379.1 hypothetical protein T4C_11210 [Trichinella pseudospiralis]
MKKGKVTAYLSSIPQNASTQLSKVEASFANQSLVKTVEHMRIQFLEPLNLFQGPPTRSVVSGSLGWEEMIKAETSPASQQDTLNLLSATCVLANQTVCRLPEMGPSPS